MNPIAEDIRAYSEWLECLRVSQDGWSKVLERITLDLNDLALALEMGKIIAHVPNHVRTRAERALRNRAKATYEI